MSTKYSLSKIEIKPITGPWWTLTQFQKGFKSANKYYVEVIDHNGKKPTKWMFKIEEVSLGTAGMQIGAGPLHAPRGNKLLDMLCRRSVQSKRIPGIDRSDQYYAELWLHDVSGNKNRLLVRNTDVEDTPPWIKTQYLNDENRTFWRSDMEPETRRQSICIRISKANAHREIIELFFASRVWVLQEGFYFREPTNDDPSLRSSDDE